MSERRSSRQRNTVNYSGFDDESDDDFAGVSRVTKKPKSSEKDDGVTKSKKSVTDKRRSNAVDVGISSAKSANPGKTRRAPLSEKVYERELQEALELSLLETGGSQPALDDIIDVMPKLEAQTLATELNSTSKQISSNSADSYTEHQSKSLATKIAPTVGFSHGTVVLDDSIELLEEADEDDISRRKVPQQRTSGRQIRKQPLVKESDNKSDDDDCFDAGSESDEDDNSSDSASSDFSEQDEESDFDCKSKKARQGKAGLNKSTASVKTSRTVNTRTRNVPRKELAASLHSCETAGDTSSKPGASGSSTGARSSEADVKSAVSSLSVKHPSQKVQSSYVPKWKPPSLVSPDKTSLSTVRSPSSGLRLGLSRNQKVKPLHPSVKVT